MLKAALSPPWGSGSPTDVTAREPAHHSQPHFSPSCANGVAPVLAAVIQGVSVPNAETPMALLTSHWHHFFLLAPFF